VRRRLAQGRINSAEQLVRLEPATSQSLDRLANYSNYKRATLLTCLLTGESVEYLKTKASMSFGLLI